MQRSTPKLSLAVNGFLGVNGSSSSTLSFLRKVQATGDGIYEHHSHPQDS